MILEDLYKAKDPIFFTVIGENAHGVVCTAAFHIAPNLDKTYFLSLFEEDGPILDSVQCTFTKIYEISIELNGGLNEDDLENFLYELVTQPLTNI